jgi:hypothetical protein
MRHLHLMPVYTSVDFLPSRASLKTTGYLPALVGSIIPAAAMTVSTHAVSQMVVARYNKKMFG